MPVALQILLIAALLFWYTTSRFEGFLNESNIFNILLLAMPLAVAAIAQTHAILVGYLDLSVGAMISFGVVVASFLIRAEAGPPPDPGRDWGHPRCAAGAGPGQRRADPGGEDPLDHRHPGHPQHPRRHLPHPASHRPGNQISADLVSLLKTSVGPIPDRFHRHRGGAACSTVAARLRIGPGGAGGGFDERPPSGVGSYQLGPGPGPPAGRSCWRRWLPSS
jgi:hypothetical protein